MGVHGRNVGRQGTGSGDGGVGRVDRAQANLTVLFVSSGGLLAGAERCLLETATVLARGPVRPIVVVPYAGKLSAELASRNLDVRVMELGVFRSRTELRSPMVLLRLLQLVPACVRLARLIRRERVDVVHSNTSAVFAGAFAALITRRPHIWHVREILPRRGPAWRLVHWLIPRLSSRVVCVSSAVMDQFDHAPPDQHQRLRLVADGIPVDDFVAAAGELHRSPSPRVGMHSRINPWKGHETFVEAAARVRQKFPDTQFFIVGECLNAYRPLRDRLVATVQRLGLDRHMTLTGYLPYHQVARLLASYDVFVLPSSSPEPLGIVLLEAMAFGKPVVATNQGGPLDVVEPGVTGLLVPPDDPSAMADALIALLESAETRRAMGRAGAARVRDLFTIERHVAQLLDVYCEATGRTGEVWSSDPCRRAA
jgi:glycosyltransferase involved in cell wall biosynthesis